VRAGQRRPRRVQFGNGARPVPAHHSRPLRTASAPTLILSV
jgi:hypothetical protein